MSLSGGSGMVGGWSPISVENQEILNNAAFAAQQVNLQANSILNKKLVNLHSAESQVVAGIKYKLVFDLGTTTVRKDANTNTSPENWELNKEQPIERYTVILWERSWLNERQLLEFSLDKSIPHDEYFGAEHQAKEREFKENWKKNLS